MDGERTCYVASFNDKVTDDLLEELFTQVGPLKKIKVLKQKDSEIRFALVEFEDEESVQFAIETLDGIKLFNLPLTVKPRSKTKQEEIWKATRSERERRQNTNTPTTTPSSSYRNDRSQPAYSTNSYERKRDSRGFG
ncbi:unnamed protein product [Caenorhabditis auriculariae]|uniref:RRM domain-containing protein n=1 Tax=Caenorhabditis auriculariae TaxID=2777116 RepID=A0A8S1GSA7_9PELO|nr:unnamed protein product [Caenorhabditis auriculariae]